MKGKTFFIILATALTLIITANFAVAADEYPTKPINFLIPFGAGGSADLMGRALASGTLRRMAIRSAGIQLRF
jgi:tripartite-type tricarboxylate transporter receptor subunit TctC